MSTRHPLTNVWISGATGAWGRAIIAHLLTLDPHPTITAYCHSESRAASLLSDFPQIKIYLGDIRDPTRVLHSIPYSAVVIHAAALKRVDTALYSPTEMSSVNIDGTKNIITASIKANASRCYFISTDKATQPTTFYGGTKFVAEQLWLSANGISPHTTFLAARYGNALASTGSVLEIWRSQIIQNKPITINKQANATTRFLLPLHTAARHVIQTITNPEAPPTSLQPSPFMPSCTVLNLLKGLLYPEPLSNYTLKYINPLPSEKDHEYLLDKDGNLYGSNGPRLLLSSPEHVHDFLTIHKLKTL